MNKELEAAFDTFIDGKECDRAQDALFSVMRLAFKAGWEAARGKEAEPQTAVIEFAKLDRVRQSDRC